MSRAEQWYEVIQHKDYLYIIRERLDEIDPRFYTKYTNLYLLLGSKKALLIDTGCGLYPLKPIIDQFINGRDLIVLNTHSHFDHRGANEEFPEIFIHEKESRNASIILDVSFLSDSPKDIVKLLDKKDFKYQPPRFIRPLNQGDLFKLGGLEVEVINTPGHSIGSISLLTTKNEIFTGDCAHYGTMFLPKRRKFPVILESLHKLLQICQTRKKIEIYPSHEEFCVDIDLLELLISEISDIDKHWHKKEKDTFLNAWILKDKNFRFVV